jgi:putative ABC transport system substrate-binding protein
LAHIEVAALPIELAVPGPYRYAENQNDRLPMLAGDLVPRRVAVIAASGTPAALAAKAASTTIPIVFGTGGDPQLLRGLIPNAALFGVLADPAFRGIQSTKAGLQAAARTLGLQLVVVYARTHSDVEPAFENFSQQHVGAVLVSNGTFFSRRMEQVAALTARHGLPAIFLYREFVLAGGLMSYGGSLGYTYHQVGVYTGRSPGLPRGHRQIQNGQTF